MEDEKPGDTFVKISVPKNGEYGEAPVVIKVPKKCQCGAMHEYEQPNPQIGEWYTYVSDPCEHTVSYVSLWKQRVANAPSSSSKLPKTSGE